MVTAAPTVAYIFVHVETRQPMYQQDPSTGSLQPWAYEDRETAEAWLDELAKLSPSQMATGQPMNREWFDIVGLDADNYAKYAEWNFPA
jgi:hypothetical protein